MTFRDIARKILIESPFPLSVRQIWAEAIRCGLDKGVHSHGKTPSATLGAWLYVQAKDPNSDIRATGRKPTLFSIGKRHDGVTSVCSRPFPRSDAHNGNPCVPSIEPKTFSFLECAEKVLRDFGAGKPMHYQDITQKAIKLGWLKSNGESPANTMNAVIGTDIKKRLSLRRPPLFAKHEKGYIGLVEWIDPIQPEIDKNNRSVMAALLSRIRSMEARDFERLIARLLDEMDFLDTEVTRYSGDGGIDVRGTWCIADGIRIKMAIQVKRWKANVQAPTVQAIRGALTGSERGMIITTSDFSKGAREEAEDQRKASTISLVNGEQLVKLLVEKGIGVSRKQVEILCLNTDSLLSQQDI